MGYIETHTIPIGPLFQQVTTVKEVHHHFIPNQVIQCTQMMVAICALMLICSLEQENQGANKKETFHRMDLILNIPLINN